MKHSLLKKFFSYFYPLILKTYHSDFSGQIELSLQNGKLVVDSANANYSYGLLHELFQEVLREFDLNRKDLKVLILGFGAGSIAKILLKEKKLNIELTGVEIDPVMLEIYEKHFKINSSSSINLYQDNALNFLEKNTQLFDFILVDIFKDLNVPEDLLQIDFIQALKKTCKENGGIAMNTMLSKDDSFMQLWKESFAEEAYFKAYHRQNLVLFKKARN